MPLSCCRQLFEQYRFSSLVRGPSNALALSVCEDLAKQSESTCDSVFLAGETGLGKSHLLHSICNNIRNNIPNLRVVYITCDDFMHLFIQSLKRPQSVRFEKYFINCDVLLFDDAHYLAHREKTQSEFLKIFNARYENKKKTVIASRVLPAEMEHVPIELKSRFQQGLLIEIQSPSYEERVDIITKFSEQYALNLQTEVIQYIANQLKKNGREILGLIKNLWLRQNALGRQLTLEEIADFLVKFR